MEPPAPDARPREFERWLVRSLVAAAGVVALVLVFGEGLIHHGKDHPETVSPPLQLMPDPPEPAALAVLRGFFEGSDTATKSGWVRDAVRVREEMEDFHDRRGHPYPTMDRVSQGRLVEFGGTPCVLFEVEPFNGTRFPVAIVWDGHRFVVDWESLTAYGTQDWEEFIETRPETSQTLRVFIRRASRAIPAMPPGHTTFLLEHRDDPQPVTVIASGETAARLTALSDHSRAPVTLELSWRPVGPGGSPIAVISRLIHPGWSR
jgi:hypothetical protein